MALFITLSDGDSVKTYVHTEEDATEAKRVCSAFFDNCTILSIEAAAVPSGKDEGGMAPTLPLRSQGFRFGASGAA